MSSPTIPGDVVAAVRAALLRFFDSSSRDLPWRATTDPYAVWVSEVMLQQTRVETVVPYYDEWLRRYPDVTALADAPLDDVLRVWAGLGYYSRARNLHAAARVVRERHDGQVPGTAEALRALPGVGDYTAGAVASIAFGAAEPAVDGNARRVLSRLLDEPAPTPSWLRTAAAALVPADRPGAFNQAVMELGSRICTPRRPRCSACPVREHCAARAAGTQLERPRPKPKRKVPTVDVATAILRQPDGRMLIVRRPPTGLLAGMWTFPGRELAPGETEDDAVMEIAARHGTATGPPVPLCVLEHAFSHRRERYACYVVPVRERAGVRESTAVRESTSGDGAWIGDDPAQYALPRAQQRIHARALEAVAGG